MTDLNEQSFSTATTPEGVAARRSKSFRQRIPAPIWRLSPTLQPVRAVRTIIPRIVLALRKAPASKAAETIETKEANCIEQFTALVLGHDEEAPFAYVEGLVAQGVSVDAILLELLTPAARQLGTLWESDATDFA